MSASLEVALAQGFHKDEGWVPSDLYGMSYKIVVSSSRDGFLEDTQNAIFGQELHPFDKFWDT